MIEQLHRYVIPAAYAVLPGIMRNDKATAFMLAIALQESEVAGVMHRRQIRGPARGFWQFEVGVKPDGEVYGGVAGVMRHRATHGPLLDALESLRYPRTSPARALHAVIEHNDILAAVLARLLLWTVPAALPGPFETDAAWRQYSTGSWNPGRPHPQTWPEHYRRAWGLVGGEH